MLEDSYPSDEYEADDRAAGLQFSIPQDGVSNVWLEKAQKQTILASWASDARAVADAPSLRQLDDGAILDIDAILEALKKLHEEPGALRTSLPWGLRLVGKD
jgi:hypothetical protein